MRSPDEWSSTVQHELGVPIKTGNVMGGAVLMAVDCTTCGNTQEVRFPKRFPPDVIRRKLIDKGFDARPGRLRCPHCVTSGKKTRSRHAPALINNTPDMERPMAARDMYRMYVTKDTLYIRISDQSPIIKLFATDDWRARYSWTMQNEILQDGSLQTTLTKHDPVTKRTFGRSGGTYVAKEKVWKLSLSRNQLDEDFFHKLPNPVSVAGKLVEDTVEYLVFQFPNDVLSNLARPIKRKPDPEPAPAPVALPEPEPEPQPEPVDTSVQDIINNVMGSSDTPPARPISVNYNIPNPFGLKLGDAIDFLNQEKERLGDRMQIIVNNDGLLSVLVQYGK